MDQKSVHAVPLDTLQASCFRIAQHKLCDLHNNLSNSDWLPATSGTTSFWQKPVTGEGHQPLSYNILLNLGFKALAVARRVLLKIA
jgi:hypothetical protein